MTRFFFLVLCLPLACLLFNTELKLLTDADHGDGGGYHSTPIVEKEKVQTDRKHMPQECAICEMDLKFCLQLHDFLPPALGVLSSNGITMIIYITSDFRGKGARRQIA
jgi:hypothetical protein